MATPRKSGRKRQLNHRLQGNHMELDVPPSLRVDLDVSPNPRSWSRANTTATTMEEYISGQEKGSNVRRGGSGDSHDTSALLAPSGFDLDHHSNRSSGADMDSRQNNAPTNPVKRGPGRPRKHPQNVVEPIPNNDSNDGSLAAEPSLARSARAAHTSTPRMTHKRQAGSLHRATDARHDKRDNPVRGDHSRAVAGSSSNDRKRRRDDDADDLGLPPEYRVGMEHDRPRIDELLEERGLHFFKDPNKPAGKIPIVEEVRNDDPTIKAPFVDFDESDRGMDPIVDKWLDDGKAKSKLRHQDLYPDEILKCKGLPRFADLDMRIQIEMIENLFHQGGWSNIDLELAFKVQKRDLIAIGEHMKIIRKRRNLDEELGSDVSRDFQVLGQTQNWGEIYDQKKAVLERDMAMNGLGFQSLAESWIDLHNSERYKALEFVKAWQLSRKYLGRTFTGEGSKHDLTKYHEYFLEGLKYDNTPPNLEQLALRQVAQQNSSVVPARSPPKVLTSRSMGGAVGSRKILQPRSIANRQVGANANATARHSTEMRGSIPQNKSIESSAEQFARQEDTDSDKDLPRMRIDSLYRGGPAVDLTTLTRPAPVARMGSLQQPARRPPTSMPLGDSPGDLSGGQAATGRNRTNASFPFPPSSSSSSASPEAPQIESAPQLQQRLPSAYGHLGRPIG